MQKQYWMLGAAMAVSFAWSFATGAQTIPEEYAKLIQERSSIGTLDGGFFGDHVSLSTGNLEIVQTDVDLPGNNALAVRVGRRFVAGNTPARGHFSDWDLDIPHLHGEFGGALAANVKWEVDATNPDHRCSEFNSPPEIYTQGGGIFTPDEYWHGTFFYLPGGGDQELLYGGATPSSGGPYPATTREGAVARCLSALAVTSEDGSTGEGFEVVTPDGTVYRFDQMVSRSATGLKKSDPAPGLMAGTGSSPRAGAILSKGNVQNIGATTNAGTCCNMSRREIFLYPTTITDRFGNTVTYTWDGDHPWRLLHITASDGRNLDLDYSSSDPASNRILAVTAPGSRTWTYAYDGTTGDLSAVAQPDQRSWQFSLHALYQDAKSTSTGASCDTIPNSGTNWIGTITAPTGAVASYTLTKTLFGRSWVFRDCKMATDQGNEYVTEPYLFIAAAITGKSITGPGLPNGGLRWIYTYGAPNQCWNPSGAPTGDPDAVICTAGSPTWRTTTVTGPDDAKTRYTFGNKYGYYTSQIGNEGLLLSREDGVNGSTALRTTTMQYGDGGAAPYGSHQGNSLRRRGDWTITGQRRPQRSVSIVQQGTTFTWAAATSCNGMPYCFDAMARPNAVVRTGINTPAATQAETIAYDDDTVHWILGQVARRTVDGLVASQTVFDANHLPWKTYAFGVLQNTFTYDTTSTAASGQLGTLKTIADGKGNTTTYASWKRGIPQSVAFADSHSRTAVVADQGWITSVTDENGFATAYAYDTMGRVTQVTYPAGDSVAWAPTTSVFEPVGSPENGVPLGHWRETVSTGNARKVTLFDALWRPVLVREYDAANVAGTDRYTVTTYDNAGRVADASYPTSIAPTMVASTATWLLGTTRPNGVRTSYDALGRPTGAQQDSELGVLTTTTEYLTSFQRRTTDARGHATTESFMAWDSPTFDWPIQVDAPENQRTLIARDSFGKPTAITRQAVSP